MMDPHQRSVIIIVDDNAATAYAKRKLLELEGYRILEAATGQEALAIAKAVLPDLMLIDVNLPDMSGFDVCHQLKTSPNTRTIKVLQTSAARIGALDRVRGLEVGADAYLVEPAEEEELFGTVRALLALGQHERENRRLIDQLRESEATLLRAQRCARAGVWDIDLRTKRVQWSEPFYDLHGLSREVVPSQEAWIANIYPEDRARVEAEYGLAMVARGAHSLEFRIQRGGEIRWLQSEGHVICDAEGRPVRMAGLTWDITERKHAEAALQQRNRQLELLARASQRLLLGGELEPALLDTLFKDIAQLIGMDMFYHYRPGKDPNVLRLETSGGITETERDQFATMRFGEPLSGQVAERRERLIIEDLQQSTHSGSHELKVTGAASYAGFPLMANGELVGTLAFLSMHRTQVSEEDVQMIQTLCDQIATALARTKLQRELRDSELRFRTLVERIGDVFWISDPEQGDVVYVSQAFAEVWGRDVQQLYDRFETWWEAIHVEDRDRVKQEFFSRVYAGQYDCEYRVIRPDGTIRWIRDHGKPLGIGKLVAGVAEDITERKQTEEALRQSHEMLLRAQQGARAGLWEIELPSGRLIWSPSYYDLFELDHALRPSVDLWLTRIHPEDRRRAEEEFRHTLREGRDQNMQFRIVLRNGCVRWIHRTGQVSFDGMGRPTKINGMSIDITARKEAEEALRLSEQRLQRVLETDAVGVLFFDQSGTLIQANDVFLRMTGYRREQIDRRELTWRKMTPPEWVETSEIQMKQVVQTGQSGPYEKEYTCGDGSRRWMLFAGRDLGDGTIVEYAVDIHDRKQAEQALRESEERFKTMADSVPVLIWMNGSKGAEFVNRAYLEFLGVSHQVDVATHDWLSYVHPEDRDRYLSKYRGAVEQRALFDEQARFRRYDGCYRWMHSVGQPRISASGELLGYVGATYDITEVKEAQERLERWSMELEQAVKEKTAQLTHWQERLRAMASELNLAEQRERKRIATELHDHLQQMLVLGKLEIGQGKRFATEVPGCDAVLKRVDMILSDALTYSRTLVAELSPPVLHELGLGAGLRWLGDYMKKRGLTVTVHVPEDNDRALPESHTVLLFQSVRELLINAAKHAGTGTATVRMDQSEDWVKIQVHDDGRGFDPAAAAVGTPTGGISSKFGLLSIQERIRALDGSFDIQSTPGQGTTATLTLPMDKRVEEKGPTIPESPLASRMSRTNDASRDALHDDRPKIRVLLVDDHVMVRQGLRAVLEAYADIELVGEGANGEDAVRLTDQRRPAVVVMDISMPLMNGIEATEVIKKRHSETIVIGLSVNAAGENQEAMKRAGAVCLMTKEAAVEELYNVIYQTVRKGEATR